MGAPSVPPAPGYAAYPTGAAGWQTATPAKKRRSPLLIILLVLGAVVLVVIGLAVVGLVLGTTDDRVEVDSEQGYTWSMSDEPREDSFDVPAADGTQLATTSWVATPTGGGTETVELYDAAGMTFDADLGLQGLAEEIGGKTAGNRDGEVAGAEGRVADIEFTVQGEPRQGRAIAALDGDVIVAVSVVDLRGDLTDAELDEQFDELVASIEAD